MGIPACACLKSAWHVPACPNSRGQQRPLDVLMRCELPSRLRAPEWDGARCAVAAAAARGPVARLVIPLASRRTPLPCDSAHPAETLPCSCSRMAISGNQVKGMDEYLLLSSLFSSRKDWRAWSPPLVRRERISLRNRAIVFCNVLASTYSKYVSGNGKWTLKSNSVMLHG